MEEVGDEAGSVGVGINELLVASSGLSLAVIVGVELRRGVLEVVDEDAEITVVDKVFVGAIDST